MDMPLPLPITVPVSDLFNAITVGTIKKLNKKYFKHNQIIFIFLPY